MEREGYNKNTARNHTPHDTRARPTSPLKNEGLFEQLARSHTSSQRPKHAGTTIKSHKIALRNKGHNSLRHTHALQTIQHMSYRTADPERDWGDFS